MDDPFIESLAHASGLRVDAAAERARSHALLFVLSPEGAGGEHAENAGEGGGDGREEFVGFALAWLVASELEILDVAVLPAYRRQGAGLILVERLLSVARAAGAEKAFLEVREDNLAAQGLYRSAGFFEVSRRHRYYKDGADALLFQCCLKPDA